MYPHLDNIKNMNLYIYIVSCNLTLGECFSIPTKKKAEDAMNHKDSLKLLNLYSGFEERIYVCTWYHDLWKHFNHLTFYRHVVR